MNPDNIDDRLFFQGKMESDKAPELLENGTYSYALNIRPYNTENGSVGVITNVEGNELIEYTFDGIDSGFLRVIGSELDLKRRRVYWFVYGITPDGDEKAYILYYSYDTGDISTVFSYDNALGFDKNTPIRSVQIVYDDTVGDTLKWVASGEAREINVTAGYNRFNYYNDANSGYVIGDIVFADTVDDGTLGQQNPYLYFPCQCISDNDVPPSYDYTDGTVTNKWKLLSIGSCYPPFLLDTMFYQKTRAPYFSPMSTYNYDDGTGDSLGSATFLRRKSFQFIYKYIMFDGQETEWSPASEAVYSQEVTSAIVNEEGSPVDISYPTPKSISIKVPIGTYRIENDSFKDVVEFPHAMVARVKIAIREVPTKETPTDWVQLADEPVENLYKYNVNNDSLSNDFPPFGTTGTYYYNWDNSYKFTPSDQVGYVSSFTFIFDGSQTLTPLNQIDTNALYYELPYNPRSQALIGNRNFFGGGEIGMDISRDIQSSLEENLSFDLESYEINFSTETTQNTLNNWQEDTTNESYSDFTASVVFDLDDTLTIAEYNETFYYNFDIRILFYFRQISPSSDQFGFTDVRTISGISQGIPNEYANFGEFIEDVITTAYNQDIVTYATVSLDSVSVNNTTGQMTLNFTSPNTSAFRFSANPFAQIVGDQPNFFTYFGYLSERTFKCFSTQQYGVVFSDNTGRLTPTLAGDWGRIEVPHFLNDSFNPVKYLTKVSGLEDIEVPSEARVMHIVRKRSESYSDFIHFCISRDNCPPQSWNAASGSSIGRQFNIGYIDLELDEPQPLATDNKYFYVTLNSVNGGFGGAYETAFSASVLNFLPQRGDVFRFLYKTDEDGVTDEIYESSFNILGYNEEFNTIVLDWNDIQSSEPYLADWLQDAYDNLTPDLGVMCEVIKKTGSENQEFYWEVASQFSCTDGAVDISSNASDIPYLYGDVYMKLRGYCIDYEENGAEVPSEFRNFILQDRNYNDFADTANVGEGRPNAVLESLWRGDNIYSKVSRDNLITYSEKSIQNTDIRKYSTLYNANIKEVDNIYGRIEFIDGEGDKISVYQEDKISYGYIDKSITTDLSGEQRVLASVESDISDLEFSSGQYGISQDATSFAKSGYQRYFTDSKRGNVYRQSMDGITVISEIGMSGHFKNSFRNIRNSFTTPIIRGIVDERTDEYILSLTYSVQTEVTVTVASSEFFQFNVPETSSYFGLFALGDTIYVDASSTGKFAPVTMNIYENQTSTYVKVDQPSPLINIDDVIRVSIPVTETFIFSERTGGWTTMLSYNAEWLTSGIQSYHTFVDGQMWFHDIGNTDYNTFHNRTFVSEIETAFNKNPQLTKYWKTIGVKSKFQNVSIEEGDIETAMEQESYIPNAIFENREDTQWAYYLKEGSGEEVLEGDKLRGRWLKAKVTFNKPDVNTDNLKVFSIVSTSGNSGLTM